MALTPYTTQHVLTNLPEGIVRLREGDCPPSGTRVTIVSPTLHAFRKASLPPIRDTIFTLTPTLSPLSPATTMSISTYGGEDLGLLGLIDLTDDVTDLEEFHFERNELDLLFENEEDGHANGHGGQSTLERTPHGAFPKQAHLWSTVWQYPHDCAITPVGFLTHCELHCANLLREGKIDWAVGGLEIAPTTGKYHVQACVHFLKKQRLTSAVKALKTKYQHPHCEAARSDARSNKIYCLKSDKDKPNEIVFEIGQLPVTGPQKVKMDWERQLALARNGEADQCDARIQICYHSNLRALAFEGAGKSLSSIPVLDNYWIVGQPGVGKSKFVRDVLGPALVAPNGMYIKDPRTKWWDGVKPYHQLVLLDDLEKEDKHMAHLLKVASDHYPFVAEIKGASTMIRPKHIVVTSNYTIEEFANGDSVLGEAIRRRFKVLVVKVYESVVQFWKEAQLGKVATFTTLSLAQGDTGPDAPKPGFFIDEEGFNV